MPVFSFWEISLLGVSTAASSFSYFFVRGNLHLRFHLTRALPVSVVAVTLSL